MKSILALFAVGVLLVPCIQAYNTTGNVLLSQALNAALTEIYTVNNEWASVAAMFPGIGLHTQTCAPNVAYYPWPSDTTTQGALSDVLTSGTLRVCGALASPPLAYLNTSTNTYVGFDIEISKRIAVHIGTHYSTTITAQFYQAILADFINGQTACHTYVGAVVPGQYNTSTFQTTGEYANLACAHYTNKISLISGPTFNGTFSLAGLNNNVVRIGVYKSSTTLTSYVKNILPSSTVSVSGPYSAPDRTTLFQWLQNGTVDVVAEISATIHFYADVYNQPTVYRIIDLGVEYASTFITNRDAAQPPVNKTAPDGDAQLRDAFQASLANMYYSGTWDAIARKWGLPTKYLSCPTAPGWYNYPDPTVFTTGRLQTVLSTRNVTLCYNNAAPYAVGNTGTGFLYDIVAQFGADLQTRYGGAAVSTHLLFSSVTPVFQDVYDLKCDGYIGAVIPGSLGLINGAYTTTAQRLYQSCAIFKDAVAVVTGPSYTGVASIAGINAAGANLRIGSNKGSSSGRTYTQNIFKALNYTTYQYDSTDDLYAALAAGSVDLVTTQEGSARYYLNNTAGSVNTSSFTIVQLYDQVLYGVAFYKTAPPTPSSTTGTPSSTTGAPASTTSAPATTTTGAPSSTTRASTTTGAPVSTTGATATTAAAATASTTSRTTSTGRSTTSSASALSVALLSAVVFAVLTTL